jgi:toxin-antitoxin system PIN domain toxin
MLMPDVNVLIYAHRADESVHEPYRKWVEALVDRPEPFAVSVLVAVAFVRIVTNGKIYSPPTPLNAALATVDVLASHPRCRLIGPTEEHWQRVSSLCRQTRATAKLVADAQHAAVAIENGCTWVTRDGDFRRFEEHGLRWQHLVLEVGA